MAQTRDSALTLPAALREVILREARNDQAVEILAAAGRSSDRLARYLESLIGAAGARALLQRSVALTRREHPRLAEVLPRAGTPLQSECLAVAERQGSGVVMESSVALLVTFVNLLVSFIGERLTVQVLCHVWPDVAPLLRSKKESP